MRVLFYDAKIRNTRPDSGIDGDDKKLEEGQLPMETDEIYFSHLEEGHSFPAYLFSVSDDDTSIYDRCTPSIKIQGPKRLEQRLSEEARQEPKPLSPLQLSNMSGMRAAIKMPEGCVLAKELIEMKAPSFSGDHLQMTIQVEKKYIKNERKFVDMRIDVTNLDRQSDAISIRRTLVWSK